MVARASQATLARRHWLRARNHVAAGFEPLVRNQCGDGLTDGERPYWRCSRRTGPASKTDLLTGRTKLGHPRRIDPTLRRDRVRSNVAVRRLCVLRVVFVCRKTIHEVQWRNWRHCDNTSPCWRHTWREQKPSWNVGNLKIRRPYISTVHTFTHNSSQYKFTTLYC